MFDYTHYVPILPSKPAEWVALEKLGVAEKRAMTPLIKVAPDTLTSDKPNVTVERKLCDLAKNIRKSWLTLPLFMDFSLVDTAAFRVQGEHPMTVLWRMVSNMILHPTFLPVLIPVTSLKPSALYLTAVKTFAPSRRGGKEVCLRLTSTDLQIPTLEGDIALLLSQLGVSLDEVHLVVDLGRITENTPPDYTNICSHIPHVMAWRTFTVASGTLPENLNDFKRHEEHTPERTEWKSWYEQVGTSLTLPRLPSFGDYAVLCPEYKPPPETHPSASIRYTTPEYYIIMRGVKPNPSNEGFQQYPAHAKALCDRTEFCGPTFSYGDNYISQQADAFVNTPLQVKKPGNPRTWLEATINHHLTLTVYQLANLHASSTAVGPSYGVDQD